jgi:hypothetical protein
MKLLRKGSKGADVTRWQEFLRGQGYNLIADGDFGPKTKKGTLGFQKKHKLVADGLVGGRTWGVALGLDFPAVELSDDWPPKPKHLKPLSSVERGKLFGRFKYKSAPTFNNPEAIKILGSWRREQIVRVHVPQLVTQGLKSNGNVYVHRRISEQFLALWQAWDDGGMLGDVLTWNGSFVPRFQRGSRTRLSNHSWGTAFDINARYNRMGAHPPKLGEVGSVRDLVPLARRYGFYWGGHFRRKDGMHFEATVGSIIA